MKRTNRLVAFVLAFLAAITLGLSTAAPASAADNCTWYNKCATLYNAGPVGLGVAHHTNQYGYNAILYPGWTTNTSLGWGNVWGFWVGSGWCVDVYRRQQIGLQQPVYWTRVNQNSWFYTDNAYDWYAYPTSCGSW